MALGSNPKHNCNAFFNLYCQVLYNTLSLHCEREPIEAWSNYYKTGFAVIQLPYNECKVLMHDLRYSASFQVDKFAPASNE